MSDRIPFPEHAWPLLRKALEHIAAHPDEFYMREFVLHRDELDEDHGDPDALTERAITEWTGHPFPACGTVACLAGHINLLAGADSRDIDEVGDGAALCALGVPSDSPAGIRLHDVFWSTFTVVTYADLRAALEDVFTFPEPLPAIPPAVSP